MVSRDFIDMNLKRQESKDILKMYFVLRDLHVVCVLWTASFFLVKWLKKQRLFAFALTGALVH